MFEQKIHIINFKILFDILEEIKSNLSFEIIYHVDQNKFIDSSKISVRSDCRYREGSVLHVCAPRAKYQKL